MNFAIASASLFCLRFAISRFAYNNADVSEFGQGNCRHVAVANMMTVSPASSSGGKSVRGGKSVCASNYFGSQSVAKRFLAAAPAADYKRIDTNPLKLEDAEKRNKRSS